jgi:ribosome maturation factor RimP
MGKGKYLKYKEIRDMSHDERKKNKKMYLVEDIVRGVQTLAQSIIETEGLDLVHVEFQREQVGWILRCYIDRLDDGRVTIEDCVQISRMLSDIFDVALETWLEEQTQKNCDQNEPKEMFLPSYNLEVSSPGERRPVSRKSDFFRFQGNDVSLTVFSAINGQKKFKGMISQANDSHVTIKTASSSVAIPYENIRIARLES